MVYRQALKVLLATLLAAPLAGVAAGAESEWLDVLKQATAKVLANYRSIRNFTCVETVQRDYYRPTAATLPRACPVLLEQRKHPTMDLVLRLVSTDRLRLEVTTTRAGEIISWVGAKKFEDASIDKVVRDGPMGTGSFGSYLDVIFEQDVKTFVPNGEAKVNGRRALAYSFRVNAADSHYRMKLTHADEWYTSAYEGDLLVDAETAEPVRLSLRTLDLPEAAELCQSMSTLDFSRVPMGAKQLLLASHASQRFIYPDGRETENITRFSSCREYVGESSVTFSPEPEPATSAPQKDTLAVVDSIPSWIRFKMELTAPIESDTAAHGDRFTARLTAPLLDGKRVLAPKGARVEGRLSLLQVDYGQKEEVWFGLTPETIEIRGSRVPFPARLSQGPDGEGQRRQKGFRIYLPPPGEHSGMFQVPGSHAVLRRGLVSEWVTVPREK
jgi:hypothetical protein